MYYIYSGYVSPDNYDNSEGPSYTIEECHTQEAVIEAKKAFEEDIHDECSYVIFRVFEGDEKKLKPKEIITEWEIT